MISPPTNQRPYMRFYNPQMVPVPGADGVLSTAEGLQPVQGDVFYRQSGADRNRFAVIGDPGTGTSLQMAVAQQMNAQYAGHPFGAVLVLGDNAYKDAVKAGPTRKSGHPDLFEKRIHEPYRLLFDQGVKFYPVLGNHDVKYGHGPEQLRYWNVPQNYSFTLGFPGNEVAFFAIDTTILAPGANGCYMGDVAGREAWRQAKTQVLWLRDALADSTAPMKVVYGHYPMYSRGAQMDAERAATQARMEELLAPLFEQYGVDLYLSGHEHHYEKPHEVNGVYYGVSGAAGKLEDERAVPQEGNGLIRQCHFMAFDITPEGLAYRAISQTGAPIDEGLIPKTLRPPRPLSPFQQRRAADRMDSGSPVRTPAVAQVGRDSTQKGSRVLEALRNCWRAVADCWWTAAGETTSRI